MPGKDGGEKKKTSPWSVLHFLPHLVGGAAAWRYLGPVLGGLAVIAIFAVVVRAVRRRIAARKIEQAKERNGTWPLGEPYRLDAIERNGATPRRCDVVFGARALQFSRGSTLVVPVADVTHVHVGRQWIDLDAADRRVRVKPRSPADRERLLWELAVRCNDAMERGLDVAAAKDAPAGSASGAGMDDLDRRMTGLGSVLAGPAASANPAPPRKSGLGVGLFVAPPGRGDGT